MIRKSVRRLRATRSRILLTFSFLLLLSLISFVFLVSYLYKSDIRLRINNNRLLQTSASANSLKTSIDTYGAIARMVPYSRQLDDDLLTDNGAIISIHTLTTKNNTTTILKKIINPLFVESNMITEENLLSALHKNRDFFNVKGVTIPSLRNISPELGIPAISMAFSAYKDPSKSKPPIIIITIDAASLISSQVPNEQIQSLIVTPDGTVIAGNPSSAVEQRLSLAELPIVHQMFTSQVNNGQLNFKDSQGTQYTGYFYRYADGYPGVISFTETETIFAGSDLLLYQNLLIMIIIMSVAILCAFIFLRGKNASVKIKKIKKRLPETSFTSSSYDKAAFMYLNFQSFAGITQQFKPKTARAHINNYMKRIIFSIRTAGGRTNSILGDVMTAMFSFSGRPETNCEKAVLCAIMIRQKIYNYNKKHNRKFPISMRCGINTGSILAGDIGTANCHNYGVIGDTIKKASHIEHLNSLLGTDILITLPVYRNVKEKFYLQKMKPIQIKGESGTMTVWAVLGRKDDRNSPKTVEELQKRFALTI
ncbi:MAG: adenylate/guanylate cyclase domain-containing protein [Spirochaetes bacterium]|jgi:adenylate cyclase|nr:adenylate/guanylate cyclase domain-containing protein [Spirochaetota bacterium]